MPYSHTLSAQPQFDIEDAPLADSFSDFGEDDDGPFIVAPPPTPDIPEPECRPIARRITVVIRPPTPEGREEDYIEDAYAKLMDGPPRPLEYGEEDEEEGEAWGGNKDEDGDVDEDEDGDEEDSKNEDEEDDKDEDEHKDEVAPEEYVQHRTRIPLGIVPFDTSYRSTSPLSDSLSPPETPSPLATPSPPDSPNAHALHGFLPRHPPIEFAFYDEMRGQGVQLSQLSENPEWSAKLMVKPDERVFWKYGLAKARLCCSWPLNPSLHREWDLQVYSRTQGHVVRQRVATEILQSYHDMLRMHTKSHHVSPILFAHGQPVELMSLERLWLVALRHVGGNRFRVDVQWRP